MVLIFILYLTLILSLYLLRFVFVVAIVVMVVLTLFFVGKDRVLPVTSLFLIALSAFLQTVLQTLIRFLYP